MNRQQRIAKATTQTFDVCIIGGGITGAGLLANAMERGWSAVLIERNDFASGTSSRSSKMIHGGLRYLQYLQFKLVRESLLERGHLLKKFPHLVKPFPYILPSYSSKLDLIVKDIVLTVYDKLAGKSIVPPHQKLSAKQVLEKLPGFKTTGLKGGIYYWDGFTNDARLTLEVMTDADNAGGVVLNYVEATRFVKNGDAVESVQCTDSINGNQLTIKAKVFINATGVWTDKVLQQLSGNAGHSMEPSKGVHVVVPSSLLPKECVAIVDSGANDKRFLYTIPWENGLTILGTTDTEYTGSIDNIDITMPDVQYILNAFNKGFPGIHLTTGNIVSVYAGVRPLLDDNKEKGSSSRSREYNIWWSEGNFINIAGGKLTSFWSMGRRCLEVVSERFKNIPLGKPAERSQLYTGKWKSIYGEAGVKLERIIAENPANEKPVSDSYKYTVAEVIFFTRCQFAAQVEDVLTRRTSITYAMKIFDETLVKNVALIMATELNKPLAWVDEQLKAYYVHWQQYHPTFLNN